MKHLFFYDAANVEIAELKGIQPTRLITESSKGEGDDHMINDGKKEKMINQKQIYPVNVEIAELLIFKGRKIQYNEIMDMLVADIIEAKGLNQGVNQVDGLVIEADRFEILMEKAQGLSTDVKDKQAAQIDNQKLLILLSGTSGTGKSTLSNAISKKIKNEYNNGREIYPISTDSIRAVLRNYSSREENPILFSHTYQCGTILAKQRGEDKKPEEVLIEGYHAQSDMMTGHVDSILKMWLNKPDGDNVLVFEGVHFSPQYMRKLRSEYKDKIYIVPSIITLEATANMENPHTSRLKGRTVARLESGNLYLANYKYIEQIRDYFKEQCKDDVAIINNIKTEESVDAIMGMIKKLDYKPPSRPLKPFNIFHFFAPSRGFMFLGLLGFAAAFLSYSGVFKRFRK